MKTKLIIFILVLLTVFVLGYHGCSKYVKYVNTVQIGENISNVQQLPSWLLDYISPNAHQISYLKKPTFYYAYEYSISEGHFLAWAKEKNISLSEIEHHAEIKRYTFRIDLAPSDDESFDNQFTASVTKGYEYQNIQNNGGGAHIIYDSLNEKAYHSYSFR